MKAPWDLKHRPGCKWANSNVPHDECSCDCFVLVERADIERLREKEATAEIIFETNKQQRAEIERLQKEVIHWREARRSCIEAGDMMKEEIDMLRQLALHYVDTIRLIKEGKPIPLDYLEARINKALGNE